uniref:Uncharacterized protein n=1 Tax=Ditylenchus dipsaci TaxID=166011 RepID=A0A915DVB4_9BILA
MRLDPLVKKSSHHKADPTAREKGKHCPRQRIAALIEGDKSMKASESDVEKVLEQVKSSKIYLCFTGDKGGLSTKFVSVGNVDDPNSVDNQM